MKLGVTYNLYDGIELLEHSINSIKSNVDYINVVYQIVSNYGYEMSASEIKIVTDKLYSIPNIDSIILYHPSLDKPPVFNELMKRNRGLDDLKCKGLTHYMLMDVDELYDQNKFSKVCKDIEDNDYENTYCHINDYYCTSEYLLEKDNSFVVNFINKLSYDSSVEHFSLCNYITDSTRRPKIKDFSKSKKYSRLDIEMDHMSFVRSNIKDKFKNNTVLGNVTFIGDIMNDFDFDSYNNKLIPEKFILPNILERSIYRLEIDEYKIKF